MAEKALDDVDVGSPAQQAGGVGVLPAVGEVAPDDPDPGAGALDRPGHGHRAVASLVALAVTRRGVDEEEGGPREGRAQAGQVVLEDGYKRGSDGQDAGLVPFPTSEMRRASRSTSWRRSIEISFCGHRGPSSRELSGMSSSECRHS